ncbi:hypothetical protein C8R44DRAFT_794003 [Mycena epipterygia]|nr:hypothetical protein C8R44DRAFT_794003 [Mycena epipterygia]
MQHNPPSAASLTSKRKVPLASSFRRALPIVSLFETPRHRRKRLEASTINALAPIASLPPEILSHIFLFCVSNSCERQSSLDWLAVAHVTHRWREIALACPELWANIVFRPKVVPIMLSRSKMVPLVIRVALDNKHFKPRDVRENISRVGLLAIRGSQEALESFFLDYTGGVPAPRLTRLSVVANTTSDDPMWLDAMLFHSPEGPASHLPRRLRLEQCALPWNSPWYSNLTYLYLADLHIAQGPTMTVLFSVIMASPMLQYLILINTNTRPDDWETFFPVELRDLHTIHLTEPISVCTQILMNLTFPSITKISVSCLPDPISDKETWLVPSLICHRDFWDMYDSLRIEAPDGPFLRISAQSNWTDKTLLICLHYGVPHLLVEPALRSLEIYSASSFSYITTLHLSLESIGFDAWRHLCECHNLSALHLHGSDPLPIFTLLLERAMRCIGVSARSEPGTDHLGLDGSCTQLFPKLEYLELQDIDCGTPWPYPTFTDVLRALLWARRAGRCPIPRLGLDRCRNVFKQDLDHLRFLTEVSTWDMEENQKEKEDKEDCGQTTRSFSLCVYVASLRFFLW